MLKIKIYLINLLFINFINSFLYNFNNKYYFNTHFYYNLLLQDEFGIRIPKFHKNDEIIKKQLMYYGPEIPEELWIKPQKPIGFFGKNNLSPEGKYMKSRRAIVIRARRRKYMKTIYYFVRRKYKEYIKNSRNISELMYWKYKLDSLPKDSSSTKFHHYCPISGRFRAYYSFFGLGRHFLREYVNMGYIPGVKPANW
uniref:Ribosomal protein S14p/S29e, putative n=2 Tax=Theileria annulata TaxID=5874 RepID=A0A3B0MSS7_THEAN